MVIVTRLLVTSPGHPSKVSISGIIPMVWVDSLCLATWTLAVEDSLGALYRPSEAAGGQKNESSGVEGWDLYLLISWA